MVLYYFYDVNWQDVNGAFDDVKSQKTLHKIITRYKKSPQYTFYVVQGGLSSFIPRNCARRFERRRYLPGARASCPCS